MQMVHPACGGGGGAMIMSSQVWGGWVGGQERGRKGRATLKICHQHTAHNMRHVHTSCITHHRTCVMCTHLHISPCLLSSPMLTLFVVLQECRASSSCLTVLYCTAGLSQLSVCCCITGHPSGVYNCTVLVLPQGILMVAGGDGSISAFTNDHMWRDIRPFVTVPGSITSISPVCDGTALLVGTAQGHVYR